MEELGGFVAFLCVIAAMPCWFAALFYMFRTVALRKPGTSLWRGTGLNPFNLLVQPHKLTDAGLIARKRCFMGTVGFVGFVLLGLAVGALTEL